MRLIDADELNEYIGRESLDTREKIFALVDRMPTLPNPCGKPCAFERPYGTCKTCKYYTPFSSYGYRNDGYCKSAITNAEGKAYINCHDEWYCANYEKAGDEKVRICDKCIHDKVCLLPKSRENCELFDEKQPHGEWEYLKEHITEMRDADGELNQKQTCQFILELMGVIEREGETDDKTSDNR